MSFFEKIESFDNWLMLSINSLNNAIFDEINLYLNDKRYDEANAKIANAIKLDPENAQLYLDLLFLYV